MIRRHGRAFAFEDSEIGCVDPRAVPPLELFTAEHEPWKLKPVPSPRALRGKLEKLLKPRLASKVLEPSGGPYAMGTRCLAERPPPRSEIEEHALLMGILRRGFTDLRAIYTREFRLTLMLLAGDSSLDSIGGGILDPIPGALVAVFTLCPLLEDFPIYGEFPIYGPERYPLPFIVGPGGAHPS
ncbi:MAG: hypothetical protein BJ554DRAFT_7414 [Olpidium bornovanus]|uniref:Uncharacterized protein n=1 Tax=Olpidium bornovanus TaxID=278681 RepID=A0A8H7ZWH3_9FUNG|nr:MAG: hypothetical protein BJ554DRAFT_7414 [Olpidium bornovanus]